MLPAAETPAPKKPTAAERKASPAPAKKRLSRLLALLLAKKGVAKPSSSATWVAPTSPKSTSPTWGGVAGPCGSCKRKDSNTTVLASFTTTLAWPAGSKAAKRKPPTKRTVTTKGRSVGRRPLSRKRPSASVVASKGLPFTRTTLSSMRVTSTKA